MKTTDQLLKRIQAFAPPPKDGPAPTRVRHAIDRVRWHICGLFGVKHTSVTDDHVAAFLRKVTAEYIFPHLPGISYEIEEQLMKWARRMP